MRSRMLWVLLLLIGIGLLALVLRHDQGTIGLEPGDFGSLVYKIVLLVFIGGAVLALFRERIMAAFQAAMLWVVIGLLLVVGYTYRFDLRDVGDRVLSELMPGRAATRNGGAVEISRGTRGDFLVIAEINGARVATVYDTGASAVVLTQEAAKAAGLPLDFLNYSVAVDTANGHARTAPVTLDRLVVGGIVERGVPALIAQPGQLKISLLGMSFLNRLRSSEVRGDKLVLRGN
jgi:aspartyl protease family protein